MRAGAKFGIPTVPTKLSPMANKPSFWPDGDTHTRRWIDHVSSRFSRFSLLRCWANLLDTRFLRKTKRPTVWTSYHHLYATTNQRSVGLGTAGFCCQFVLMQVEPDEISYNVVISACTLPNLTKTTRLSCVLHKLALLTDVDSDFGWWPLLLLLFVLFLLLLLPFYLKYSSTCCLRVRFYWNEHFSPDHFKHVFIAQAVMLCKWHDINCLFLTWSGQGQQASKWEVGPKNFWKSDGRQYNGDSSTRGNSQW